MSPESQAGVDAGIAPVLSILIVGRPVPPLQEWCAHLPPHLPIELLTATPPADAPTRLAVQPLPDLSPSATIAVGRSQARGRKLWVLTGDQQPSADALERVLDLAVQHRRSETFLLPVLPGRGHVLPPVGWLCRPGDGARPQAQMQTPQGALWSALLTESPPPMITPTPPVATAAPPSRPAARLQLRDAIDLAARTARARPVWTRYALQAAAAAPWPIRLRSWPGIFWRNVRLDGALFRATRRPPDWLPLAGAGLAGLAVAWIGVHMRLGALALAALIAAVMTVAWLPRTTLAGIYALLLFDGALRKWVLRGGQQIVYFGKDLLLVLLAIRQLVAGPPADVPPPRPLPAFVRLPLLLFTAWLLLELFNPAQPSLTFWAFGLRVYLLPLLLLMVLPTLLPREQVDRLLTAFVLASIPIGLVAALQSLLGPDHWLNQYAWGDMDVARFGGRREGLVRATATFSYITGYTSYLTTAAMLAPFAAYRLAPRRVAPLGLLYAWLLISAIFSGSRGPVLIIAVGVPLIAMPLFARLGAVQLLRVWVVSAVAIVLFGVLFRDPIEHFRGRVEQTRDVSERLSRLVRGPLEAAGSAGIFGQGLATEHQSRDILLRRSGTWKPLPPFVEEELSRVTIELGAIGALLAWWFRIAAGAMCLLWLRGAMRSGNARDQLILSGGLLLTIWTLATSLFYDVTMYYGWATLLALARTTGPAPGAST